MSNEHKDWMWENRQDAQRAIILLEDAREILSELQGIECAVSVSNQICVSIHALRNESNATSEAEERRKDYDRNIRQTEKVGRDTR